MCELEKRWCVLGVGGGAGVGQGWGRGGVGGGIKNVELILKILF